jgi:CheY-like chemotaxis protein
MTTNSARILIVDDEADTCDNLSDILSDLGYDVDIATNGPAALKCVEAAHYDVALLDLRMPGMDGLELYRLIKEKSASTVALVVTAYASSEQATAVLAAGARKIVSKPVNIPYLLSIVEEAVVSPVVMVVDDDCELCENLWDIFHEAGYRVHLAHDSQDAAAWLKEHRVEIVLLDMKLPGGDSQHVLRTIREENPQARTIIVTGYRQEMELRVQQALSEGASAVVYKPFDVQELIHTVRSCTNS